MSASPSSATNSMPRSNAPSATPRRRRLPRPPPRRPLLDEECWRGSGGRRRCARRPAFSISSRPSDRRFARREDRREIAPGRPCAHLVGRHARPVAPLEACAALERACLDEALPPPICSAPCAPSSSRSWMPPRLGENGACAPPSLPGGQTAACRDCAEQQRGRMRSRLGGLSRRRLVGPPSRATGSRIQAIPTP